MTTGIKRRREPPRIVGDLLSAEIAEKRARSIKYQLTIAKLPLAKSLPRRVCAAGLTTGSAETRRVFRYRSNRRQYLCRAIFQYRSAADVVGGNATLVPTKTGLLRA